MLRGLSGFEWVDASGVMGAAKIVKTVDEVSCIRRAQLLNELAMVDALRALRPGVRQIDLSAVFLRRVFELGASAGGIDPIWQVMAPSRELGPWTLHGDLAYPTVTTDRFLRHGDVIWVDAGIIWEGYASDYGRTWIVGADPNALQLGQFRRWRGVVDACLDILRPGVSGLQLCRAAIEANDGVRPWIEHFYLAHGVGTDSAEMPLIGTDFGEGFDEQLVMQPGMVAVFEPVIWEDGAAGYRSEDIVAVTDTGLGQTERLNLRSVRFRRMSPVPRDRGVLIGMMGLEDDARVDFSLLRAERRAKVFSGMETHGYRCPDARWCRRCALRVGGAPARTSRCFAVRAGRRGGAVDRSGASAVDLGRGGAAGDRAAKTCMG